MKYKRTIKKILIISVCVFIAAVIFSDLADKYNNFGLYWTTVETMVQVPAFFSFSLFVISLILFFLREEVFHSWKKFAIVYLPLAAVILYATAGESGGGIGVARIDGEIISWFLSGFFLFISILIIGVKSWKLRRGK
ncbi:MAG TPA: hypothetical protein VJC11_00100 [Patescibacteria group bacterium]|nr:hypothetical protein [Patescibacteria group bacterium]